MDIQTQVSEGMTVYGSDNQKVGKISAVDNGYFVVEKGFFFPTDYYIPTSAIASSDGDNVYLALTKDQAMNEQTWTAPPLTDGYVETAPVAGMDTTGYAASAADLSVDATPPFEHEQDNPRSHVQDSDTIRVREYEEELTAVKREVDRGAVRIEKDVITEERTMDVPVTEERVRVSRVAVDSNAAYDTTDAFQEGVIEVPLTGQEVDLQRTAHVAGEVVIEKEAVERTERVGGTVRREQVRVDEGSVQAVDDVTGSGNSGKRRGN